MCAPRKPRRHLRRFLRSARRISPELRNRRLLLSRALVQNTKINPRAQAGPVQRVGNTRMPTKWGMFRAMAFEREISKGDRRVETALALVLGNVTKGVPLVRIHSQCLTGAMLGSLRCDCGDQFEMAMRAIAEEGRGLLIYDH